jgi:hypothetical protein
VLLAYSIRDPRTTWELIFSTMEEAKRTWPNYLEDYAVGETTLEQIFLTFARDQIPDASRYKTTCCCCRRGGRRNSSVDVEVTEVDGQRPRSGFTM